MAVSRGELVEIGGGFRVPDVMAQSGARLVEVGTTNRTRRADFERVASVGRSRRCCSRSTSRTIKIVGFTETVEVADLVRARPPRRGRHRLGPGRCRDAVAQGRPTQMARRRTGRAANAGSRRRPGDVLRRQAGRRPPGGDHRRKAPTSFPLRQRTRSPGHCALAGWFSLHSRTLRSPTWTGGAPTSLSGGWRRSAPPSCAIEPPRSLLRQA